MTWAFDVDGTLIGSIRSDRLRPGAVELLAALSDRGLTLVLWSAGGAAYAERMAHAHGIAHYFTAFYAKAERGPDARYLVDHLSEGHRPQVFVDDSPIDLPSGAAIVEVPQFLGGNPADQALWELLADLDGYLGGDRP